MTTKHLDILKELFDLKIGVVPRLYKLSPNLSGPMVAEYKRVMGYAFYYIQQLNEATPNSSVFENINYPKHVNKVECLVFVNHIWALNNMCNQTEDLAKFLRAYKAYGKHGVHDAFIEQAELSKILNLSDLVDVMAENSSNHALFPGLLSAFLPSLLVNPIQNAH